MLDKARGLDAYTLLFAYVSLQRYMFRNGQYCLFMLTSQKRRASVTAQGQGKVFVISDAQCCTLLDLRVWGKTHMESKVIYLIYKN